MVSVADTQGYCGVETAVDNKKMKEHGSVPIKLSQQKIGSGPDLACRSTLGIDQGLPCRMDPTRFGQWGEISQEGEGERLLAPAGSRQSGYIPQPKA